MPVDGDVLHTLHVAVHGQRTGRLSDDELMRWEAMLSSADHAVEACMAARTHVKPPENDSAAVEALKAVVNTVCALTGAREPASLDSKRVLVSWTFNALSALKRDARPARPGGALPVLSDPKQVAGCMELVCRLNSMLGGAEGRASAWSD